MFFLKHGVQANDSSTSSSSPATASGTTAIESHPSSTLGNLDRATPDFESLKIESVRLATLPAAHIVEPRELARAGMFYTGQADHRVQCAFYRDYVRNWVHGDEPPHCSFVKQQGVDVGGIPGPPTQYVCQFFFK